MPRRSSIAALPSAPPLPLYYSLDLLPLGLASGIHDTGTSGLYLVDCWRWLYQPPEKHSRISRAELQYIVADKNEDDLQQGNTARPRWRDLLKLPQTWGVIVAKLFTDPVWFFITDWFPIYLVAKGIELRSSLVAIWIPFIAADIGNFLGDHLRLPDQAGMVARCCPKGAHYLWWHRGHDADTDHFYEQPVHDRVSVWLCHILFRRFLHYGKCAATRSFQKRIRSLRKRAERNWRSPGDDRRIQAHRIFLRRASTDGRALLRSHRNRRRAGSIRRNDPGVATCTQYQSNRLGIGQAHLAPRTFPGC